MKKRSHNNKRRLLRERERERNAILKFHRKIEN